jgi:predicted ribosome-associated RNA-binding protein Tma20
MAFRNKPLEGLRPAGHLHAADAGVIFYSDIEAGDHVVVAEETHGKVLAVGRALTDGADMVGDSGKVVESLHHVGDELYGFT